MWISSLLFCKAHINCVWKQCLKIPPQTNQTLLWVIHASSEILVLTKWVTCLFFPIIPQGLIVSSAEFAYNTKTIPVHKQKRQWWILVLSNPLWSLFSQSGIMPLSGTSPNKPAPPNKRKKLSKIITDLSHITQDGKTPTTWALSLIVAKSLNISKHMVQVEKCHLR